MALAVLAVVALTAASAALPGQACSPAAFVSGVDLMGGDLEPLGVGFRNASSAAACCAACAATQGCNFFSSAVATIVWPNVGPGHNCWLKATAGTPKKNPGRVCGASGAQPLPPLPPAPAPAKAKDACFPEPTAAWCDTSKPNTERVALLVKALTLAEKIIQISTFTPSTVPGVERVGLPPFSYHSEGLHGLRNSFDTVGFNATVFPQVTAMAATGNFSLIAEMGGVMLKEARALSNYATDHSLGPFGRGAGLFYWSPTMNLGRDPRWGRFQESVSEDPHLNGVYSSTLVKAFQGDDPKHLATACTCKHFIGYSLEGGDAAGGFSRHNFDAKISEQDMQESYLPSFRQCVKEGKPAQIMW